MRRPTYPEVASTLALVVALSTGGAYAAGKITGADIKDGSITGRDLKQKSVQKGDLAPSARPKPGPAGPAGPEGPQGVPGAPGTDGPVSTFSGSADLVEGVNILTEWTVPAEHAGRNLAVIDVSVLQRSTGAPFEAQSEADCALQLGATTFGTARVVLTSLPDGATGSLPRQIATDVQVMQLEEGDVVKLRCFSFDGETRANGTMTFLKVG